MPRLEKHPPSHRCKHCGGTDIEAVDEQLVFEDNDGGLLLCAQLFPDTRDGEARDPGTNWTDRFPLPISPKAIYFLVHNGMFSATFKGGPEHGYITILATGGVFPARLAWKGLVPSKLDDLDDAMEYVREQMKKVEKATKKKGK